MSAYDKRLSELMYGVSSQLTAPPTIQQTGDMDPLLHRALGDPHQTFNVVARTLKDQAHHVQLATADVHIGDDHLAHQLRQQLEAWWRQMRELASTYQHLQGEFSDMLYSQKGVLQQLHILASTLVSNVEFALQLESCSSSEPEQRTACKQFTTELLQGCRDATSKAQTKIKNHETLAHKVQQKQKDLASELLNAEASMEEASRTAYQQHVVAARELEGARQAAVSRRRDAQAASDVVMPAGVMTLGLCVFAPATCLISLAGTGASVVLAGSAAHKANSAEHALFRSSALQQAVRNVHSESLRAEQATSRIREVVKKQSSWVTAMLKGLSNIDEILSEVIDVTLKVSVHERKLVLQQLHRELGRLLSAARELLDKSSPTQLVVHMQ
jgi:hypothetical protein